MGIVERLAFTECKIVLDLLLAVRPSLMICADGVVRRINVPTVEVADQTLRLLKGFYRPILTGLLPATL